MIGFLNTLSFATPLALWGLLALPIIWWLLRFTPPRPQTIKFPPLRILLSLQSQEETPDKTPWWLLLLRLALAAILIFAVAHPQLRGSSTGYQGSGPLLLIIDDGWASAKSWTKREEALSTVLDEASNAGRTVVVATTTPALQPTDLKIMAASDALDFVHALRPLALSTDRLNLLSRLKAQNIKANTVTWLSDGLDANSAKSFADGLKTLYGDTLTALTLEESDLPIAIARPTIDGSDIKVTALRAASGAKTARVQAIAGNGRILAEAPINFGSGTSATAKITLPIELRNEIQNITIANENHAGARQLLDDRWRRKTIAVQSGATQEATQPLLSPLHYVTKALEPFADLTEPRNPIELKSELDSGLSMLVLADIGRIPTESRDAILPWIEKGGVLLRFAGPRLASTTDDLLPVVLREGDRNLGSALSWETPQTVLPFSQTSPFAGLVVDSQVTVSRQVLAEPDVSLAQNTWASLSDGTPLITATKKGKGLIVLFHITANPDWSNLPLSGTFVEMLQRITDLAPAAGSNTSASTLNVTTTDFAAHLLLTGSGDLASPTVAVNPIPIANFDKAKASPQTPAGTYLRGDLERAINLDLSEKDLAPIAGVTLQQVAPPQIFSYAPQLFIAAAILFLADTLAALFLGGAFRKKWQNAAATILAFFVVFNIAGQTPKAFADDQSDMRATLETHLAYVKTGDTEIDTTSELGLKGLGLITGDRTSADLGAPIGINIEADEIVFYPLLYWPVTEQAQSPSEAALLRLDAYMKNGGTIFFDLRDGGSIGSTSGTGEALKRILAKLDIPALEPVPENHVLGRTFYLLKQFPGRYEDAPLWVETQNTSDTISNSDGVSGIIIGSNDYAAAWAMDDQGNFLNALVPGSDRQREMAFRTGINIVMYTLTGNYKTDQVHIPALLERLGQ